MLKALASLFAPGPAWRDGITDPWFRDHFVHAASTAYGWLSAEMNVAGAEILDFGCGDGITDLGFALKYSPKKLTGVDVTKSFTRLGETAKTQIGLKKLPGNLEFRQIDAGQHLAGTMIVDAIFSWSTFEHVETPFLEPVARDLFDTLRPGGLFFLQIDPLYYSPYGSHLARFVKTPWAHLVLSEKELKDAVLNHRDDIPANEKEYNFYARNFEDYKAFIYNEYLKLNRITPDELVDLFASCGFAILRQERARVSLSLPETLSDRYPVDDLMTNEIRLLMRKP